VLGCSSWRTGRHEQKDGRTRAHLLDGVWQTDLTQQRLAAVGLAGVSGGGPATRDVAHIQANLLLLGTRQGVPARVIAQIMGHTKVDTTMNVYTQVLDSATRLAADRIGSELFRIVQIPDGATTPTH
jgi:integrase